VLRHGDVRKENSKEYGIRPTGLLVEVQNRHRVPTGHTHMRWDAMWAPQPSGREGEENNAYPHTKSNSHFPTARHVACALTH
jgi:hypothetical protein